METKVCTKCGIKKPIEQFYFRKDRGRYDSCCKACRAGYIKQYYKSHKDEIIANCRQYRESHKDKIIARDKKYRESHGNEISQRLKQYYKSNKDKLNLKSSQYYKSNKDKLKSYSIQYEKCHMDDVKKRHRGYASYLHDLYIKNCIYHVLGLHPDQIPPELIESYREQIKLKRLIKSIKNEKSKSITPG